MSIYIGFKVTNCLADIDGASYNPCIHCIFKINTVLLIGLLDVTPSKFEMIFCYVVASWCLQDQ